MSALLLFMCLALFSFVDLGASVNPGVYFLNLTSSISNGTSAPFVVYSATGLNVNIDNSSLIYNTSAVNLTWVPFAGSAFNATAKLNYLNSPSLSFNNVTLPDVGSASVNLTLFGTLAPGYYNITLYTELGFGTSNRFIVSSTTPLSVVFQPPTEHPTGSLLPVSWDPKNSLGLANVSILRLSNGSLIPVLIDIPDNGTVTIPLSYPPGAYQIIVNSSIGNGTSDVLEITTPFDTLNVTATPNNVSAVDGVTNITWAPFDTYQENIKITIYTSAHIPVGKVFPNNTGFYSLNVSIFNLPPAMYILNVTSNIGSGNATLNLYSATGLNISTPNATSIIYNDSTSTPVQWTPSDFGITNASITLLNQNNFQNYTVLVPNSGVSMLDLVALGVPAGTYNLSIDTSLGYGQTDMFVIRYAQFLNISSPNATANISDVGVLDMNWLPTNPAGGNATIYLYQPANTSAFYGPFETVDDGVAFINLATDIINKNLLLEDNSVGKNVLAAKERVATGLLSPKKTQKKE